MTTEQYKKVFTNSTRVYLYELLTVLNSTGPNQRQKRIDILEEYVSKGKDHEALLRSFVECLYHPAVVFDIPSGTPPYKENTSPDYDYAGRSLFNFFNERITTYFVKGQKNYIQNEVRRQTLFIQQLEGLYKDDAKVLLMIKNKELHACKKFINKELFMEAFPGWLPDEVSPKGKDLGK